MKTQPVLFLFPWIQRTFLLALISCSVLMSHRARTAEFHLSTATIADIHAAVDAGALTYDRLVSMYLRRIDAYDKKGPKLNAVLYINENANEEARALDLERRTQGRRSPLHGIPVVIKDLIDLEGYPTTAGFKPFGAPIADRDAGVVTRLKEAGAIIIAKVSTVNWFGNAGFDQHPIGATLNPYNIEHSPGGSSNGTGAAVASWFATVGIGTDTGGSVQIPSSYNSLVGIVATQGLVTRTGIVPRGPTQDRAGPMTRSVYDAAATLGVIAGWDAEDLMTFEGIGHFPPKDLAAELGAPALHGKRIGVLREMFTTGPLDPEVLALFERAVADLREGGALVLDPVLVGTNLREATSSAVAGTTHPYELVLAGNAYLERLGPNRPFRTIQDMLTAAGHENIHERYLRSMQLPSPDRSPDYLARASLKDALRETVTDLMVQYRLDALVLPYRTLPPPAGTLTQTPTDINTLTSVTGLPAVIMPGGYTQEKNLPVGIQFVGRPFDDINLIRVSHAYEVQSRRRQSPALTPALPGESFTY
jgi:Asp-tRNA(Asn)/Glu-tRNA(Gln) amidotransferase A subunit family amidase